MTTFANTLASFCADLKLSFPEMASQIDRASTVSPTDFLKAWRPHLAILRDRDISALFQKRGGALLSAVNLSKKLWAELSESTHAIIWKYLRTLALEAVLEVGSDKMDESTMEVLMAILMEEKTSTSNPDIKSVFEESMKNMKPLLDRLKEFMGSAGLDASGSEFSFPEIPAHLRTGRIARLAEELTKQFDPTEFGIDPSLLTGDNIEELMKKLAEIFQNDPTKLMAGAKTMAEKIKRKITDGSINRDELLSEAQEFMTLFKDHPLFKETLSKVESMMGADGLASFFKGADAEPSARRATVQERLRRKLAERKSGAQSK